MKNIFNGKEIEKGYAFGITDNYFTSISFSTSINKPPEYHNVLYFPNPKQSRWDRFWNGIAYIFMSMDYVDASIISLNIKNEIHKKDNL